MVNPRSAHYASVSEDERFWFCSLDDTHSGTLSKNHLVWLEPYTFGKCVHALKYGEFHCMH